MRAPTYGRRLAKLWPQPQCPADDSNRHLHLHEVELARQAAISATSLNPMEAPY